jgi:DNA-binding GntR family transcriptional regulator
MAFQSIKAAILSNKPKAERIYNGQGLAKTFGVSKTHVRETLLELTTKRRCGYEDGS